MSSITRALLAMTALAAATGCATVSDADLTRQAADVLRASFKERGQAKLDRLNQDQPQAVCSVEPDRKPPVAELERMEKAQQALIKYPVDGKMLGDWREGEKIAQSGVGKQFSDNPANPAGGNCYACHQITREEISFGTIGPPLLNYGKLRGVSEAMQRYTYGKIYNPQAFAACSNMPRFGHNSILTEQQIKHLTALLLDPASPVNK
jgi:sulfur-oxidizing protein SoxX